MHLRAELSLWRGPRQHHDRSAPETSRPDCLDGMAIRGATTTSSVIIVDVCSREISKLISTAHMRRIADRQLLGPTADCQPRVSDLK